MNPEFVWAIIVIFLALALAAAAIGLYFYWKDNKDYDENKKIIVWGLAIGSIVTIICGILLLVWGIQKKRHIDTTKKIAKQSQPATSRMPVTPISQRSPVQFANKGDTSY